MCSYREKYVWSSSIYIYGRENQLAFLPEILKLAWSHENIVGILCWLFFVVVINLVCLPKNGELSKSCLKILLAFILGLWIISLFAIVLLRNKSNQDSVHTKAITSVILKKAK